MDLQEILSIARQRLEERGVPQGEQDALLDLVNLLLMIAGKGTEIGDGEELIQRLADTYAGNQHLQAVIRRQAAELDAIKRISINLTSSLQLPDVLHAVVREAMRLVKDSHNANIFLYQNGKLTFGAALDSDGGQSILFSDPRPEGLTGTIARDRKMIVVDNVRHHPLFREAPKEWNGSIIGFPLMIGERVVGVMTLARLVVGGFTDSETRLLSLLADQAALAIINARLHEAVNIQARSDMLTGLPNRRALDEKLEAEVRRGFRSGHPFSVVMMDVDGFKVINDTWGHNVGDDILRLVAQTFLQVIRTTDFLARYGGDELTLILPETGWPQAEVVTRKIQDELKKLDVQLPDGSVTHLSVSGGVAVFPSHAREASSLLRAADQALYRAKRHQPGNFLLAEPLTGPLKPPSI